jgi:regulator of nucleoside diphosphate kinase
LAARYSRPQYFVGGTADDEDMAMTTFTATALPPITLTQADRERLVRLTQGESQAADFLAREVERAHIVSQPKADLVTMGAGVDFRDEATGQVRSVTLVYPEEADIASSRVSVLTPVGAALIGLSKNQSIEWQTPAGERRVLTVLQVRPPSQPSH